MKARIEESEGTRPDRSRTSPTALTQFAALVGLLLPVFACSDRGDGLAEGPRSHEIGSVTQAISTKRVGVHATKSYEPVVGDPDSDGWLVEFDDQWDLSDGFVDTISSYDTVRYYNDLTGKQYYWHDTGDQATNSLEDVDLFFAVTHGGITDGWQTNGTWWEGDWPKGRHAIWAMWDTQSSWPYGKYAYSGNMRLGDDLGTRKLSIFSTYACDSMHIDGDLQTRWGKIFRGGLRMACGGHGGTGAGAAAAAVGSTYAHYLQIFALREAWIWATTSVDAGNPVATMSAADTLDHCYDRLVTMTWRNFDSYYRYRDNAAKKVCISYVN